MPIKLRGTKGPLQAQRVMLPPLRRWHFEPQDNPEKHQMPELPLSSDAGRPATIHRPCVTEAQQQQASSTTGQGSPVSPKHVHACRSAVQAAAGHAPSSRRPP